MKLFLAVLPIIILIIIMVAKRIPYIGGNVKFGTAFAGILALMLANQFNPIIWLSAWFNGVNRLAWVFCLIIAGAVYSAALFKLGAMETVVGALNAKFGSRPRGVMISIFITMVIAGSLMGDSLAAATVIVAVAVPALRNLKLSGEKISAIIVLSGSLGSVMPPISGALFIGASLQNVNPDEVTAQAYLPIFIVTVLSCIYMTYTFISKEEAKELEKILATEETAGSILKRQWTTLVPVLILAALVFARIIPILKFDLISMVLNKITVAGQPFLPWLAKIPLLGGLSNLIVLAIILTTIITFICYKDVRINAREIFKESGQNLKKSMPVMLCVSMMLGGFYVSGMMDTIVEYTQTLQDTVLKLGGAGSLALLGMLSGVQSLPQNLVMPFYGPALIGMGFEPARASLIGSFFAVAGQGLPPADLVTFAVSAMVGGMIGEKVDPLKVMLRASFYCFLMIGVGLLYLFVF